MAFKLPLFDRNIKLVREDGRPETTFHQWWQAVVRSIEAALNGLQGAIDAIEIALQAAGIALEAAATAQEAAQQAQDAADNAQGTGDQTTWVTNLVNSGPIGVTISAEDTGTDVTVSISSHNREYGNGQIVPVFGGSVTGLAYETGYFIIYVDPDRTGGSVVYLAVLSEDNASQIGDRHLVGYVVTPVAADPPTVGAPQRPPGVNIGRELIV